MNSYLYNMNSPLLGVHAFYSSQIDEGQFKSVELVCQLASALYWRKNFGPIGLFTSPERESQLIKYGLHHAYSFVDTVHHEEVVMHENPRYWAYPKMLTAKRLSLDFDKFCMLDTDLYIKTREHFDFNSSILTYHGEKTDATDYPGVGYITGTQLYDLAELESPVENWTPWATNTAILYFNGVADFIHEWMYHVDKIIENSHKWESIIGAGDQIFVEQYLLPNLAKDRGVAIKTYLNADWIPGEKVNVTHFNPEMEAWILHESIKEANSKFSNVFHLWGLKYSLNYAVVRQEVLGKILSDLDQDFPHLNEAYPLLMTEVRELYKDQTDYGLGILVKDKLKAQKDGKSKKISSANTRKSKFST